MAVKFVLHQIEDFVQGSWWVVFICIVLAICIIGCLTICILCFCNGVWWCYKQCQICCNHTSASTDDIWDGKNIDEMKNQNNICYQQQPRRRVLHGNNRVPYHSVAIQDDEDEAKIMEICNVLVVLICVGKYDGNANNKYKAVDLKCNAMNKENMIRLFRNKYNYNVIANATDRCTLKEYKQIIACAQKQFATNNYQCVITIYSGHGDRETIKFSDIKQTSNDQYIYSEMDRTLFESSFSGTKVANKIDAFKLFLIDACRGYEHAKPVSPSEGLMSKGPSTSITNIRQADARRLVLHPNTANYIAYDMPKKGGILLSSLYDVMMDDKNYNKNVGEIYDLMKIYADNRLLDVQLRNGQNVKRTSIIEMDTTMQIRELGGMCFIQNKNQSFRDNFMESSVETNHILYV